MSAELTVSRYDINIYNIKNDCPLSKGEEKRLGFVTLTIDGLNKAPKLKQAIDFVEKGFEEVTKRGIFYTLIQIPVNLLNTIIG